MRTPSILPAFVFAVSLSFGSVAALAQAPLNTLTPQEKAQGWKLLWDGKSGDGWRRTRSAEFPVSGWTFTNGVLTAVGAKTHDGPTGGDIVTVKSYGDFELTCDFRITHGGNSGIKYFVDIEHHQDTDPSLGLEYQILDDAVHPDAKLGRDGDRTQGSLYDLIPASANKKSNPVGEWNTAKIVVRNAHTEQWLNGVKVVEFERFTPEFRRLVAESKYKNIPQFGELHEGHILLQDHGDSVSFRNIKIHELKPQPAK
jgi:hypothetical protein